MSVRSSFFPLAVGVCSLVALAACDSNETTSATSTGGSSTGGSASGGLAAGGSSAGGAASGGSSSGGSAGGPEGGAGGGGFPVEDADYYVAPQGDDANPGSEAEPFATWQKCADVLEPGELCYLRGGVYPLSGERRDGVNVSRSGTESAPIRMFAYPGERPVLDCSGYTYQGSKYCLLHHADWWHYRGLEIEGVVIDNTDGTAYAAGISVGGSHNVLEMMDSHHHEGTGISVVEASSNNLLLNCDSHENYDPSADGGNSDGYHLAYLTGTGNVVRGCRSWSNSDDGYDLWDSNVPVLIEDSWAFWNGYVPGTSTEAGNGDGFKCGRNGDGPEHVVQRCKAFENRTRGYDTNGAAGPLAWLNDLAWQNGTVSFQAVDYPHRLRNNIAVGPDNNLGVEVDEAFNSWTLPVVADDADFESTDSTGTDSPRAWDGTLPRPDFLRLTADSDLRGAGENGADLGP